MGKKLKNAPLYFAIVQARFNPILTIESYAPQIQEQLRKEGYPDAKKGLLTTVNVINLTMPTETSGAQIPMGQSVRFFFNDMDQTSGFILDQGALSFQTTEYDTFESFLTKFLKGLEAVHKAVDQGLSYTERLGVRYLDLVYPGKKEQLSEFLNGSVLGLSEKLHGYINHSFSETFMKLPDLNLLARVVIQRGQVGFPPDLLPMNLKIGKRFLIDDLHATLDTDGFIEGRETFNLNQIGKRLESIHNGIEKIFWLMVTEKAIKTWE